MGFTDDRFTDGRGTSVSPSVLFSPTDFITVTDEIGPSVKLDNVVVYGPYLILEKCGPIAYKLQLPDHARIHLVFHVSLLKPYHTTAGQAEPQQTELPPFTDEGVSILEPQTNLDTRWIKHRGHLVEESLVQWKNLSTDDATWELTE